MYTLYELKMEHPCGFITNNYYEDLERVKRYSNRLQMEGWFGFYSELQFERIEDIANRRKVKPTQTTDLPSLKW